MREKSHFVMRKNNSHIMTILLSRTILSVINHSLEQTNKLTIAFWGSYENKNDFTHFTDGDDNLGICDEYL